MEIKKENSPTSRLLVQAGFRKGKGTRNQIANICWIIQKAQEFQKDTCFFFIDYARSHIYLDAFAHVAFAHKPTHVSAHTH